MSSRLNSNTKANLAREDSESAGGYIYLFNRFFLIFLPQKVYLFIRLMLSFGLTIIRQ